MSTANFVQANDPKFGKPAGPEKPPEPIIEEKLFVTVKSATCKCTVTVTGDVDGGIRKMIPVHKCNGSHDAKMRELAVIAQKRMLVLLDQLSAVREKL